MKKFVLSYGLIGGCLLIGLGLFNWFVIAQMFGWPMSMIVILCWRVGPLGMVQNRSRANRYDNLFVLDFEFKVA